MVWSFTKQPQLVKNFAKPILGFKEIKLIPRNSRADKFKKCGPLSPDIVTELKMLSLIKVL